MSQEETKIVPFQKKVSTVRELMTKMQPQMEKALPKHLSIERFNRVALTSMQKNPKLFDCDPKTLLAAMMTAAALGLECDSVIGEAYLIPYGKTCQLIPGYRGLMKLARNTRTLSAFDAHEVYQNDEYDFCYGLNARLTHTPVQKNRGELIAFYAVATFKDGGGQFNWMWKEEVDEVRNNSQGYRYAMEHGKDHPWITHYVEMGKKTPIRRLCKYLHLSAELARMITLDEQAEAGLAQDLDIIDLEVEPENKPASKLDAVVDDDAKKRQSKVEQEKKPTAAPEDQIVFLCQKKGIPDEALVTKLGQMGIEEKKEIQNKHLKELIEWATSWQAPAKKSTPTQKDLAE